MTNQEIKLKLQEYQQLFFNKYSEPYCDHLSFLKVQWGYVKLFLLSVMGAKIKNAKPEDVLMGQCYYNDLIQQHGHFLD